MKIRQSRRQIAKVSHSRWVAYATAGAATALVGSNSMEAAIHYSGRLDVKFPPHSDKSHRFPLDQPSDHFSLMHYHRSSSARFNIIGFSHGFRGFTLGGVGIYLVSKLSFGQNISSGYFVGTRFSTNYLAGGFYTSQTQWGDPGIGFIGFKFNSGAGVQYGWARIRMLGSDRQNGFKLIDYAYADPGEPIRAGQCHNSMGPDEGSLGGLAFGAVGLLAWRKRRSRTAS